ncbi:amino acid adenylation domain-containing protein [Streptomyces sp. NPDC053048]|uniref:amino acid adenylation domain-containing protein n=1 Tax=Streptomyces sp. NPDC053048 TaxID=3365694 RepID=UPI0037D9150F
MTTGRRFSCVLVGENSLLVSCAEILLERGHRVLGVVSPDAGIRAWARDAGLPATDFGADLVAHLSAEPFDYLFSIVNLRMMPRQVLDLARELPVNFHDGPLPRHAGLHATTWAVLGREHTHGVTWHLMTERVDAGDVLVRRTVPVEPAETSETLNVKCLEAGIDSFGELVVALEHGRVRRQPQDFALRTCHGRLERPPGGGFLRWDRPAEELDAAVRAADFGPHANSFGTAKAVLGDRPVLVRRLETLPGRAGRPPGTVLATGEDGGVEVATAGRDVRLSRLATPHGTPLDARELAERGVRPGVRLATPDAALLDAAHRAEAASLRDEAFWIRRLTGLTPGDLPYRTETRPLPALVPALVPVPDGAAGAEWLLTAFLAFLVRVGVAPGTDVRLRLPGRPDTGHRVVDALYADWVPLRVPALDGRTFPQLRAEVAQRLREATGRGPLAHDAWTRYPQLRGRRADGSLPITVQLTDGEGDGEPEPPPPGTALWIRIPQGPGPCQWAAADGPPAGYAAAYLRALDRAPDADPARVPLGTDEGRRAAAAWNDTAAAFPLTTPVHRLIAERARQQPGAPAVVYDGRTVGRGELDRRSSALAGHLRALGVGPGRRAGVYLERSPDLVVALLGIMKAGAAYVPLDPRCPPGRIDRMMADAAVPLVVTSSVLADRLPRTGAGILSLDRDQAVIEAAQPEHGAHVPAGADAYVIYTSGSTGHPKGVRISHRSLTNFVCAMARDPGLDDRDRLLAVTTVSFDIAGLELYGPLATGGQVELAPAEVAADGFRLRRLLESRRPTVMQATPATWRMLLDAGWRGQPQDAAPLRMLCGGEALPPDLAGELLSRGGRLWNLYGPTETTVWSAVSEVLPGRPPLIGPPIANTRFHVRDATTGRPLPPGVPGELYIGGEGVASGYLNRPELTAERFVSVPDADGTLYRTGDLVRQRPDDGHLEFLGRIDDQVKVRGHRIEPGEIETALRTHPSVADAVVTVREERLVAYVVPHGTPAAPGRLREHLGAALPGWMIPSLFVTLERIPRTASGKTDRNALPRPCPAPSDAPDGAADGTERAIAEVWRDVLRLDRVGVEDNFFEVGGDSLLLMRVMARLRTRARLPLTRVEMFMYPTIRSLARRLDPPESPRRPATRAALGELRRRRGG